jgi:hypothetical protein
MTKENIDKLYNHVFKGGIVTDEKFSILIVRHEFKPCILYNISGNGWKKIKIDDKEQFRLLIKVNLKEYQFKDFLLKSWLYDDFLGWWTTT